MPNIAKKIAIGAIWMVAVRLCMKGISLVSTFILVRLLIPDDFGLMAMASSVAALIELIRMFGFDTVLIKNQKAGRVEYDTAWTIGVIFSLVAAICIIAVADIAADYYHDQRLSFLLKIMSLTFLMSGFNNVGIIEFRKQFQFNKEFQFQLLCKLSSFCVTMALAWYLRSYWALVMGTLAGSLVSLILSYSLQPYRPTITLKEWKQILGFSSWLMLNNFIFFILQNAQNFILGRVAGSGALGIYSIANEIGSITHSEIIAPINRSAYPGYSKVADDLNALKTTYLKLLGYIALISFPCGVGIAAVAPVLVPVLLGEKWFTAIPIIQLIAISSVFLALSSNASYVFMVLGKQGINTFTLCLKLIILMPLLFILTKEYAGQGAAFSFFIAVAVEFIAVFIIIHKVLKIKFVLLVSAFYRPLLASVIMFSFILYIYNELGGYFINQHGIIGLLLLVSLGFVSFLFSILVFCVLSRNEGCIEFLILKRFFNIIYFRATKAIKIIF